MRYSFCAVGPLERRIRAIWVRVVTIVAGKPSSCEQRSPIGWAQDLRYDERPDGFVQERLRGQE